MTGGNKFEWSDKEDGKIFSEGIAVAWMAGRAEAIQRFVEALSYKIGHKCDWSYTGGRAHIDVLPDGYILAIEAINDKDFMKDYIVPYSEENYENGTYCILI